MVLVLEWERPQGRPFFGKKKNREKKGGRSAEKKGRKLGAGGGERGLERKNYLQQEIENTLGREKIFII